MSFKILLGRSFDRSITLQSAEFKCTAELKKNEIHYTYGPLPTIQRKLVKWRKLPIPRIVHFWFSMFTSMGVAGKGAMLLLLLIAGHAAVSPVTKATPSAYNPLYSLIGVLIGIVPIYLFSRVIRPWHGAEHMVISAYERTGGWKMDEIEKESPVNPKCGTRFMAPFWMAIFTADVLNGYFGWSRELTFLVLIETAMWVDQFVGFDKIPVFREASFWLQRYVTTSTPGKNELYVAETAMIGLARAHGEYEPNERLN